MLIHQFRTDRNEGIEQRMGEPINANITQAIEKLIRWELMYGGTITKLTDVSAEVTTPILNKIDRTVFESENEDEMTELRTAIALWLEAKKDVDKDKVIEKVIAMTKGNALLVVSMTPLIYGDAIANQMFEKYCS